MRTFTVVDVGQNTWNEVATAFRDADLLDSVQDGDLLHVGLLALRADSQEFEKKLDKELIGDVIC